MVLFGKRNHGERHGDDWGTMQFINIAFVKALDQASHRLSAALACAGRCEVKTDMICTCHQIYSMKSFCVPLPLQCYVFSLSKIYSRFESNCNEIAIH